MAGDEYEATDESHKNRFELLDIAKNLEECYIKEVDKRTKKGSDNILRFCELTRIIMMVYDSTIEAYDSEDVAAAGPAMDEKENKQTYGTQISWDTEASEQVLDLFRDLGNQLHLFKKEVSEGLSEMKSDIIMLKESNAGNKKPQVISDQAIDVNTYAGVALTKGYRE